MNEQNQIETCVLHEAVMGRFSGDAFWNYEQRKHLAITGWVLDKTGSTSLGSHQEGYRVTQMSDNKFKVEKNMVSNGTLKYYSFTRDTSKIRDKQRFAELEEELKTLRQQLSKTSKLAPEMTTLKGKIFYNLGLNLLLLAFVLPFPFLLVKEILFFVKYNQKFAEDIRLINEYNERVAEIEREIEEITDFTSSKEEMDKFKKKDLIGYLPMFLLLALFLLLNVYAWVTAISGF